MSAAAVFWINFLLAFATLICAARVALYLLDEWRAWKGEKREAAIAERYRREGLR